MIAARSIAPRQPLRSRERATPSTSRNGPVSRMRIGILGSGLMGGKLGTIFARAGHEVVFSYSHSKAKLTKLARDAGKQARAGTPAEAAQDADALLLAGHWAPIDDGLEQKGGILRQAIT